MVRSQTGFADWENLLFKLTLCLDDPRNGSRTSIVRNPVFGLVGWAGWRMLDCFSRVSLLELYKRLDTCHAAKFIECCFPINSWIHRDCSGWMSRFGVRVRGQALDGEFRPEVNSRLGWNGGELFTLTMSNLHANDEWREFKSAVIPILRDSVVFIVSLGLALGIGEAVHRFETISDSLLFTVMAKFCEINLYIASLLGVVLSTSDGLAKRNGLDRSRTRSRLMIATCLALVVVLLLNPNVAKRLFPTINANAEFKPADNHNPR